MYFLEIDYFIYLQLVAFSIPSTTDDRLANLLPFPFITLVTDFSFPNIKKKNNGMRRWIKPHWRKRSIDFGLYQMPLQMT